MRDIILLTYTPKMASERIRLAMNNKKVSSKSVWLDNETDRMKLNLFMNKHKPTTNFEVTQIDSHTLSRMIYEKNLRGQNVDNIPQVDIAHLAKLFAMQKQYDSYVYPAQGITSVLRARKMLNKQNPDNDGESEQ